MRCKNCKYTYYYYTEGYELCQLFEYGDGIDEKGNRRITENRKGEEGCRYNQKTLDKMYKKYKERCHKGWASVLEMEMGVENKLKKKEVKENEN